MEDEDDTVDAAPETSEDAEDTEDAFIPEAAEGLPAKDAVPETGEVRASMNSEQDAKRFAGSKESAREKAALT